MKKLLVFASGTSQGGGSGFKVLAQNARSGLLDGEIVGVVSHHRKGGVRKIADTYGVCFELLTGPFNSTSYQEIIRKYKPDFIALSGWLKKTISLDSRKTINIHPGPLPRFGGKGMYGHHVHKAVLSAFQANELKHSAVTMHFVTEEFDQGPVIFRRNVDILAHDSVDTLASRVNIAEHDWQTTITNLVLRGLISWDGKNQNSLVVPSWYHCHGQY
jgi:phosphoribosylglycinamide formyltransferase 1